MTDHDYDWDAVMADIAHDEARERRLDPAQSPEWNRPQTADEDRQLKEWARQYRWPNEDGTNPVDSRRRKR